MMRVTAVNMPRLVKIVTDSAADIPVELCREEDITVLPMMIYFGEEEYRDGIDLLPKAFYERLRRGEAMPKTAQPLLSEVTRAFEKLTADGSSVVVIHLSSALSGTYSTSLMVAEEMRESGADITVIDSHSASFGLGMLVLKAARMAKEGASPQEITADIEERIPRVNHLFILETIDYLLKGGRIGKAQAVVGSMLDIKPFLYIDDHGKILARSKARGRRRSIEQLLAEVEARWTPPVSQSIGVIHADCLEEAEVVAAEIKRRLAPQSLTIVDMTSTVGTHVGPGLIGIIFESDKGRG